MSNAKDIWEEDLINGPKRRERIAYGVAALGVTLGVVGFVSAMAMLPLKTVETHLVVVDKTSGQMDRVAKVQDLTLSESDALIQANLVSYVDQRETYDLTDSEQRINSVLQRSSDDAAHSLRWLWTAGNENYPLDVYGTEAKIEVVIKSVNQLQKGVAQVRFTRTLKQPRQTAPVTRGYVATINYQFEPDTKATLQEVWGNPLGFNVSSYRVDAETLEN